MDYNAFKEAVMAAAKAAGLEEYELYYEGGEDTSVGVFQHEINQFSSTVSGGVCFRCVVKGKMGYASTEDMAAALVERAMNNAAVLEAEEAVFLCEGGKTYEKLNITPYALPTTEEMVSTALSAQEKLYAADPKVVDGCESEVLRQTFRVAICNSKGLDLSYENALSGLVSAAVVSDGKEMTNDYQIELGKLDTIDVDAVVKKAAEKAVGKLGGDVAPTAVCPVVFAPEAMKNLLAAFSSVFSSEAAQKGLSRLGDKEGQVIASPAVTLVDDPFHPQSPVPIHFDGEGCPTHTKKVIENGKLNTLLYNLKTAAVAGKETTGNGAKSGYASAVGIRPFTFYLAPGSLTEEELLKKAGKGVYINSLGGLHAGANAVSGDFSLQSAGFLIEDGKKTIPVKSFTVAGNFYDLLKKITDVASELEVKATGKTAFASPAVLVSELSIAGK
jgi:PmbA protein